ncbi:MAG: HAMP domain-containing histidine kinase [Ruminococcaceae bacterium]|nr:HAMP domain-containing histidine kinase [Oscillospiraceae bacterium]
MKSSFSRIFFPVVTILLAALLLVGLFFQVRIRSVLSRRRLDELEENADTLTGLIYAYSQDAHAVPQELMVNLFLGAQTSRADLVLCDQTGRLVYCADHPMDCPHQGYTLESSFLEQVKRKETVRSTGRISGLYTESRYVVSVALTDESGQFLGLLILSDPISDTLSILSAFSNIYLVIALIVILVAAVIVWFFIRRQSVPLRQMADTARRFGHGELNARVQVNDKYSEEIQELALAFNNMAASLQKSEYQRQEFVANVSHELKTPMTTISGYVDGILDGTIPPDRLSLVSQETKRLSRLVRSMLEISRLQDQEGVPEEKKTRFDVLEAAGRVLISFERAISEKELEVEVDFPELPLYTRANEDAITQVIYNLVDNAVKFCPPKGNLGLKVRHGGQKIFVSVRNDGPTIPPEELPLVFDRFHKLDKSRALNRDGWGLGLYIVKTLVCSHGENISVTSQNEVTEFTFTLPFVH